MVPRPPRGGKIPACCRPMRRVLIAVLFASLAAACASKDKPAPSSNDKSRPMTATETQWPALDEKLLADAAATYNFRLGIPTPLAITPDGAVLFRRTAARAFAADLFELDTKTGAVKTLYAVSGG